LLKATDPDLYDVTEDLTRGIGAAQRVLGRINQAVDKKARADAVVDLTARVEDWKGHNIQQFGDLIMNGTFTVIKGDGRNDVEREVCLHFWIGEITYANTKSALLQYKIYLFEKILLCCKEINPNKNKNKVMSMNKPTQPPGKKPRLQLKGRIFMQNVTETLSLQKPGIYKTAPSPTTTLILGLGSYTVQIWWKGDPGVENFIIRFINEATMREWYNTVDQQRKLWSTQGKAANGRASGSTSTSTTQFLFPGGGAPLENPYQEEEDDDDDDDSYGTQINTPTSDFSQSRNTSNSSLRTRPTTAESGPQMSQLNRVPPPRFPMGAHQAPLAVETRMQSMGANSPGPNMNGIPNNSYFSPVAESATSRSSSNSAQFPFPRQNTGSGGYSEENINRYTAPAMGRTSSREGQNLTTRTSSMQRPSLPGMPPSQQSISTQQRMRSASSPDIHNPVRRGLPNGPAQPPVPNIPAHLSNGNGVPNRGQNNSPSQNYQSNAAAFRELPLRANTQSPSVQMERMNSQQSYRNPYGRETTPVSALRGQGPSITRAISPPFNNSSTPTNDNYDPPPSTNLKIKVHINGTYMTLIAGLNSTYRGLVDRIDAKLSRSMDLSIGNGSLKLRYKDEDGDFITIRSDEDLQEAFNDWKEQQRGNSIGGLAMGEISLYCVESQ
jgi:cell division control protein 24